MSEWSITIERTGFNIDMRWHWIIREDGHLPPELDFTGYAQTRKRARRKAERAIEKIIRKREQQPGPQQRESYFYHYEPRGHDEEAAT